MSTIQSDNSKKTDQVLALLRDLASTSDSEVVKFLLYANPSCSGLVTSSTSDKVIQETNHNIENFKNRLQYIYLNRGKPFNYEGLEKSVRKVFIPSRVSFAIKSLLTVLRLANLFLMKINIEDALGNEWPERNRDKDSRKIIKEQGEIYIDRSVINSLISHVENELSVTLPKIIDLMYERKYVAIGAFTYSLTEIKCYAVNPAFIQSVSSWLVNEFIPKFRQHSGAAEIGAVISSNDFVRSNISREITDAKSRLIFEEWCEIKISSRSKEPSFPSSYEKMARLAATRLGKNLFIKEDVQFKSASEQFLVNFQEMISQMVLAYAKQALPASSLLLQMMRLDTATIDNYLVQLRANGQSIYTHEYRCLESLLTVSALFDSINSARINGNKNDFQENMRKLFLESILAVHSIVSSHTSDVQQISKTMLEVVRAIIYDLYRSSVAIDLDIYICKIDTFVEYDSNGYREDTFDRFAEDAGYLANFVLGGESYVNERLMMSIHKFFSLYSDFFVRGGVKDARKHIPSSVERVIVGLPTFDQIKRTQLIDADTKPGLVISRENLQYIEPDSLQQEFIAAWQHVNGHSQTESSGFTQKSVMSIISAVRVNQDKNEDLVPKTQDTINFFKGVKAIANRMDEYASLIDAYTGHYFTFMAKAQAGEAKAKREEDNKMNALKKFMSTTSAAQQHTAPVYQQQAPVYTQQAQFNYPPVNSPPATQNVASSFADNIAPISDYTSSHAIPAPVVSEMPAVHVPHVSTGMPAMPSVPAVASGMPTLPSMPVTMPTMPAAPVHTETHSPVKTEHPPVMPSLPQPQVTTPVKTEHPPVMPSLSQPQVTTPVGLRSPTASANMPSAFGQQLGTSSPTASANMPSAFGQQLGTSSPTASANMPGSSFN